jgi:regulator of sigma E protease
MWIVLLIIGLVLFISLVVVHEFGHFMAARRNGVEVEEFGIGFPPRAWKRKTKKGFLFTLNWLPIGGFVKLKGESDSDTSKGSFGAASFWVKTKIMLAGVLMNLVVAFLLLTVVAWLGMPQLVDNQFTVESDTSVAKNEVLVGFVEEGSPADEAGLQTRDQLLAIATNGHAEVIESAEQLPDVTQQFAGQEVTITYERDGQEYAATTQLRDGSEAEGSAYLGLAPTEFTLQQSTWSAPIVALGLIKQFTVLTFQGLGTAISAIFQGDGARAAEQVAGPVGIVAVLKEGSLLGYQFVLMIVAIISLSLAIINVLPIPALDGGRFYMLLLARLFGKKLSRNMEERIVGASFVFLLLLIVLITVVDVQRFF